MGAKSIYSRDQLPTMQQWFARFPDLGANPLFMLRFRLLNNLRVSVRAYEGPPDGSHTRLYCELRVRDGKKSSKTNYLFSDGKFHVGIPFNQSIDGNYAKEAVLSLFAMKPGDTDAEFFEGYTPEQLAFAEQYGEEIGIIGHYRYCDENGDVK